MYTKVYLLWVENETHIKLEHVVQTKTKNIVFP